MVPLLRTAEEARQLVQASKFPPVGRRGFGSPIALERFNPVPSFTEYLEQANDALLTMVQIETKEAFESVDEIAAVDGVDVLFIGPFDLGSYSPLLCPHSIFPYLPQGYIPCKGGTNRLTVRMLGNNIGHPILNGVVKPELTDALAKILSASHKAGKKCGIYATSGEQARQFAEQGYDMVCVATDHTALDFTLRESLAVASSKAKPTKGGSY